MKLLPDFLLSALRLAILPAVFVISLPVLLMSGCSDKPSEKKATQVVAKVNGDEISIYQLNNAMALLPTVTTAQLPSARRDVLEKLVNQQLAVQQAISLKLDRSPEVMMQLDAARREVLTRAYLKKLVANQVQPTAEETQKFYDTHPQLFAERRIYSLQEISLAADSIDMAELHKLAEGKSMAEIAAQLKERDIPFGAHTGTRAAEQIQLPMLNQLADLQDGQTSINQNNKVITILHLTLSQRSPMKQETALKQIPKYLNNERSKTIINADLEHLKHQAKITYLDQPASSDGELPRAPSAKELASPIDASATPVTTVDKGIAGID